MKHSTPKLRLLSIFLLISVIISLVAATSLLSFGVAADSSLVYFEDFSYSDNKNTSSVLSTLGWSLSEAYKTNTAAYSISGGKLIVDNSSKSSNDSYATILTDEYMRDVCDGDYSIQYDITYLYAATADRYVCLLYGYNGYDTYNSVHIRASGIGNNQSRINGSWKTYDATANTAVNSASNTNENSIIKKVFDQDYIKGIPGLIGKKMTVRIAVSKTNGPSVYINDILVSETVNKGSFDNFTSYAIAIKPSLNIKAEIDNIRVWRGSEKASTSTTVGYKPSEKTIDISVASANLLASNPSVRFNEIKQFFKDHSPDVIGLQEIKSTFDPLLEYLEKEENGAYKATDLKLDGRNVINMAPILYNSQKFELVEGELAHGAFEYADTYPSSDSKILSWAILRDKETGRRFLAMNTHMSVYVDSYTGYTSADAVKWRTSNAHEALKKVDEIYSIYGQLPTFFTGDFNMQNHEQSYRILLQRFNDSQIFAPDAINFQGSYNSQYEEGQHLAKEKYPIDHIYISEDDWQVNSFKVVREDYSIKMTDHYALVAKLTLSSITAPKPSLVEGSYSGTSTVSLGTARALGAKILYTLDGSDPRVFGKEYSSPLKINGNVTLKAVTEYFGSYSEVMTANYSSPISSPIVITRAIKSSPGMDLFEGFELVNVSDHEIDLADYRAFYASADTEEELQAIGYIDTVKNMRLSSIAGKYILKPGQTAYICTIFSDHYKEADKSSGYKIVSKGENGYATYNTSEIRRLYKDQTGSSIPSDVLLVPLDRTTGSYFVNRENNSLVNSFNMENKKYARLYITYDHAETPASSLAWIYLTRIESEGAFIYTPNAYSEMEYDTFTSGKYNVGMYTKAQHEALQSIMKVVPDSFSSKLIKTADVTTKPADTTAKSPETTKSPEATTTPSETKLPKDTTANTTAPENTTRPVETTSPETTKSPETTTPSETTLPKDSSASTTASEETKDPGVTTPSQSADETSDLPSPTDSDSTTPSKPTSPYESTQSVIDLPKNEIPTLEIILACIAVAAILICLLVAAVIIFKNQKKNKHG